MWPNVKFIPFSFCANPFNRYFCGVKPMIKPMSTDVMIQKIAEYFKTQPVLKAWLFGSYSRGEERPDSDVDILFVPDMSQKFSLFTLGGMYMDLKDILNREVDLIPENSLLPFAKHSAERDKKLIYERTAER